MTFKLFIDEFRREESGQDILEYALVLAAFLAAVVAYDLFIRHDRHRTRQDQHRNFRSSYTMTLEGAGSNLPIWHGGTVINLK